MRGILGVLLCAIGVSSFGYGQVFKDTLSIYEHCKKEQGLLEARRHGTSILSFSKAIPAYEKTAVWEKGIACYIAVEENQWPNSLLKGRFKTSQKAQKLDREYLSNGNLLKAKMYDNLGALATNAVVNATRYYSTKDLVRTLNAKGQALKLKYLKSKNIEDLEDCVRLYLQMDDIINRIRYSYRNYKDKLLFLELVKDVYNNAMEVQSILYEKTKSASAFEAYFQCAEKSKSNTLKDILSVTAFKQSVVIPDTLRAFEKRLKTNLDFNRTQMLLEESKIPVDTLKIRQYREVFLRLTIEEDSLAKVLKTRNDQDHRLKHESKVVSIKEIQQRIDKATTLVTFFTTDSITYAFTISKDAYAVHVLKTPDLSRKVMAFRTAMLAGNIKEYKRLGYALYETLMLPIKKDLIGDTLLIVPDGVLWNLNFDLLLSEVTEDMHPAELPYVLREYAVSLGNSATLLFKAFHESDKKVKQENCVAFSFSDRAHVPAVKSMSLETLREAGDDLPGTRKEIKAISKIVDGRYYYGVNADEATFKKEAGNCKILHLALHGEVDDKHPEYSKLYFTKGRDTIEDNCLYSYELFTLNIPAELVVLSACNTGVGKVSKGEGVMSLGHAFRYAGAKSLLLSSWEVSDETTPQIMRSFYTNLKAGMTKPRALQKAKLSYLKNANMYKTAPFYWGGFYLLGEPATLNIERSYFWWWLLGVVVLFCILVVVYRYPFIRVEKDV